MGCGSSVEVSKEFLEAIEIPKKDQVPMPAQQYILKPRDIQKMQYNCDVYMFLLEEGYSIAAANHVYTAETNWLMNLIRVDMLHDFDRTHLQDVNRKPRNTEEYLRHRGMLGQNETLQ